MFYYEYIITSVISLFHINWFLTKNLETIYTCKDSTIHMYIIYILIAKSTFKYIILRSV